MKKFIIQSIALLILTFASLIFATGKTPFNLSFRAQPTNSSQVKIGDIKISAEIADNASKRQLGLGGRDSLASDSGMLFIFDKEDKVAFWMKGLKFPLDLIWIKNSRVVDIIKDAKPPLEGQKDEDLPIYLPNQPVNMVLEVNSGFVDSQGIKIGDVVELVRN